MTHIYKYVHSHINTFTHTKLNTTDKPDTNVVIFTFVVGYVYNYHKKLCLGLYTGP